MYVSTGKMCFSATRIRDREARAAEFLSEVTCIEAISAGFKRESHRKAHYLGNLAAK
jgi:hypothetical protein